MTPATFFSGVRAALFHTMSQSQVDGCTALLEASKDLPLTWRAYLFATAYHETAQTMQPIRERGALAYFGKYEPGTRIGAMLGNTVKGDGYLYRGRGYVQLTGRANFAKAGKMIGADLIGTPDLALDPSNAADIAIMGMSEGWFTGKAFKDYLPGNYIAARRIINGTDRAELIASYAERFESALA